MNLVPSEASPIFTNRYDAIVVGSGSGGSALALRLGQLGMEVLIVEAGDYLRPESIAPGPNGRFIHAITGRPGSAQQFVGGRPVLHVQRAHAVIGDGLAQLFRDRCLHLR